MATVAELGARALRKLGLTPVSVADQTTSGTTLTLAVVAADALRLLGLNPYAESAVPAASGTTALAAVATRALRRLGVVAADETPAAADTTLAEEKVTAVHEMLTATNFVTWAISAIPSNVAEQYTILAAHDIAPAFGIVAPPEMAIAAREEIRRVALSGAAGQTIAEAAVTAAHQACNALGYVTFATSAIPPAFAGPYASMAAARMRPIVGGGEDHAAYGAGLALVRDYAMSGSRGQAMAEEKVRAAHASLDARGISRWVLADIPDYAEEPLVLMAAELLAPEVGRPFPNGMYGMGEREMRRVTAMPTSRGVVQAVYY